MQNDRHACCHCGKIYNKNATTFPFCCERCRMSDLGSWASETYRMPGDTAKVSQAVTRYALKDRGK